MTLLGESPFPYGEIEDFVGSINPDNFLGNFEYYQGTHIPYPGHKYFTTVYFYNEGECVLNMLNPPEDVVKEIHLKFPKAVKQIVFDEGGFKKAKTEYNQIINALKAKFKEDLFAHFGIEGGTKAERAYDLAYSRGHSHGFSEVVYEFSELVDLIR